MKWERVKCKFVKSSQVSSNINHYEKLWFEQNIRASAQHFLPPSILQSSVTSALLGSINYTIFEQSQFLFSPSVSPDDINNVSVNPCNRALLSNLAEFREIENITVARLIFAQLSTKLEAFLHLQIILNSKHDSVITLLYKAFKVPANLLLRLSVNKNIKNHKTKTQIRQKPNTNYNK